VQRTRAHTHTGAHSNLHGVFADLGGKSAFKSIKRAHLMRNSYHMYTQNCFFVFALHLDLYKSRENKYLISKMSISLFFFI